MTLRWRSLWCDAVGHGTKTDVHLAPTCTRYLPHTYWSCSCGRQSLEESSPYSYCIGKDRPACSCRSMRDGIRGELRLIGIDWNCSLVCSSLNQKYQPVVRRSSYRSDPKRTWDSCGYRTYISSCCRKHQASRYGFLPWFRDHCCRASYLYFSPDRCWSCILHYCGKNWPRVLVVIQNSLSSSSVLLQKPLHSLYSPSNRDEAVPGSLRVLQRLYLLLQQRVAGSLQGKNHTI